MNEHLDNSDWNRLTVNKAIKQTEDAIATLRKKGTLRASQELSHATRSLWAKFAEDYQIGTGDGQIADSVERTLLKSFYLIQELNEPNLKPSEKLRIAQLAEHIATRLVYVQALKKGGLTAFQSLFNEAMEGKLRPQLPNAFSPEVETKLIEIDREMVAYFAKHPERLYELPPRRFEELIEELLRDMGCETFLTPGTRDGGRDIILRFATPLGQLMGIVECKRYKPGSLVGIEYVERFLYVLDRKDKANFGLMATTSGYSREAWKLQREERWRLHLKELSHITDWLSQYGHWTQAKVAGLWLPSAKNVV